MRLLFALAIHRFALESSVLLIDDVDLASSSDRRGALLRGLGELVPDAQLVVTTRSPSTGELPRHRRIVLGGSS